MTSEPHPALSVPVYRAVLDVNLGHKTATFDELGMRAVREAWASCSAELDRQSAEIATLTDEVDRLNQSLSWEQHRSGRIGTHGPNCHLWGWQHYECLLSRFKTLENLMTDTHSIERTSPKGGPFIGRCVKCGKDGLTFSNMEDACANPAGTSQEEDLMAALETPND